VSREVVWWALRKPVVKEMVDERGNARTMAKILHGNSEEFMVKVALHQGLVLVP